VIVYFSAGHSHTHFTYVVTGRSISMITVVGATGNVGRPRAESLIEAGEPVRMTTRSAEKAHAFAGRADVAVIDFDHARAEVERAGALPSRAQEPRYD
jgi:nucleoside-diphosphate-sugar epimerase